jgi:hypothetical protein
MEENISMKTGSPKSCGKPQALDYVGRERIMKLEGASRIPGERKEV